MFSLAILLLFCALVTTVASTMNKCPTYVPILFVIVALLVQFWGR